MPLAGGEASPGKRPKEKASAPPIDVERFLNPTGTGGDRSAAYDMLAAQVAAADSSPRFSGSLVGGVPAQPTPPTLADARARIMAVNTVTNPTTQAPAMAARSGAFMQQWQPEEADAGSWRDYEYGGTPDDQGDRPDTLPRILNGSALNAEREAAYAALDEALRGQRVKALEKSGAPDKPTPVRKQVDRMTAEEYEALTPTQKAAVEFNAMLVQSVRKDRKMGEDYDPTQKQEERYQESVDEMFGADGGSEEYAPATMALLKQIDYQDEHADLDDFLGLKAAIRVKDLDDLTPPSTPPAVTVSGESPMSDLKLERVSVSREIAEKTQEMGEALAKGNQLLHNLQASATVARNEQVQLLGGEHLTQPNAPVGYDAPVFDANGMPTDLNSYFHMAFEGLAAEGANTQEVLSIAQEELKPAEFGAFMTYAENRSRQAQQYGGRLGTSEGVTYRSPEEFRKMLGLDRETR